MNRHFQKISALMVFIWRQERVRLMIWIISIAAISIVVAAAFPNLYPTAIERQLIGEAMSNPAMISMFGPVYGLDNYHYGAVFAQEMLLFTAIAVAIMNILTVIRHTREDEENGRTEMIRSLPVGKLANVGSILTVMCIANLVLAFTVGLGLAALGIENMDWEGSFLYGAALGVTGIFFAAGTAFFAQLAETARGAVGYSFAFLGLSYIVRGIGDTGFEPLSYVSPLGLILRTQVYVQNYWWPVLIMLLASSGLSLLVFHLNNRRDLTSGLFPSRTGRVHTSKLLQSPLGLAFHILRITIIGWALGMLILGASYGSIFEDINSFFENSDFIKSMIRPIEGFSWTEQFIPMLLAIMAMIGTVPVIIIVFRWKKEEKANRLENLLGRAVSKTDLVGGYLLLAAAMSVTVQLLTVIGLWSAMAMVMETPMRFGSLLYGALAYLPPIWVMIGLALVLSVYAPRFFSAVWLYLGYAFFIVYLSEVLRLPEWMNKLTPFGHIPNVPLESMDFATPAVLTLISVTLMVIGIRGFRQKDIYG
jgi:ABC-2 type transport system permease protein